MRKEIRELLQESGYQDFTLGNILSTFQKRYQGYMCGEPGFPHEMGVLLGYPVEDVSGFMEQNGQNALYQGYWKVYAHVPEKKRLFARYDMEKETIIQLLSNGVGMRDIIGIYNDSMPQKAAVQEVEKMSKIQGATVINGEGVICQEAPDDDAVAACESLGKQLAGM